MPPSRERRRHRTLVITAWVFFAFVVVSHIIHRITDRHAWPDPLPTVSLTPPTSTLPAESNAWHSLSLLHLPIEEHIDKRSAAMTELATFALHGFSTPTNTYPAIEAWVELLTPALPHWLQAADTPASWSPFAESPNEAYRTLGDIVELSRFTPYLAAQARAQGDFPRCITLWRAALRNAAHVTYGNGSAGHVVAFDITTTTIRDILRTDPSLLAPYIPELTDLLLSLETATAPLSDAIRFDATIAHRALSAFFAESPSDLPPGFDRPAGFFRWLARHLGSSPETSRAHLDAIVSAVVAAADLPYRATGLYADLPAWCRGRRPPWTNDPAAALAVTAFRDNTLAAGVYPILRLTELRAARTALALATSPDAPLSIPDPFSTNATPFILTAPAPAWHFHSVGPDQLDNGGSNDWASASRAAPGLDLLYAAPR